MTPTDLLRTTVLENPYIQASGHVPYPKQALFLVAPHLDVMYGGQVAGGKSDALLMCALQYVREPKYAGLILMRKLAAFEQAQTLIHRSHEWLAQTDARWNEGDLIWYFPSGAMIKFGHIQHENDIYGFQGSEYQTVCFDELTMFSESQFTYLFSRMRRTLDNLIPTRMRSATNPIGPGRAWVRKRYVEESDPDRLWIPSLRTDNESLDHADYDRVLNQLDPVTRAQLAEGDWEIEAAGNMFRASWFEYVDQKDVPVGARRVRFWDFAATKPGPNKRPDWTVGTRIAEYDGIFYVEDQRRVQETPRAVEELMRATAEEDGFGCDIAWEEEPGSNAQYASDHFRHDVLPAFHTFPRHSTGKKEERAKPASALCEQGRVKLVRKPWNRRLLDELVVFPGGANDDQVDSLSGGLAFLKERIPVNRGLNRTLVVRGTGYDVVDRTANRPVRILRTGLTKQPRKPLFRPGGGRNATRA